MLTVDDVPVLTEWLARKEGAKRSSFPYTIVRYSLTLYRQGVREERKPLRLVTGVTGPNEHLSGSAKGRHPVIPPSSTLGQQGS